MPSLSLHSSPPPPTLTSHSPPPRCNNQVWWCDEFHTPHQHFALSIPANLLSSVQLVRISIGYHFRRCCGGSDWDIAAADLVVDKLEVSWLVSLSFETYWVKVYVP
ncbi:hypothetical protein TSUD_158520 [Trifolium subterraneum]|uniref:Uncharacterized protein n=1 Tax=Trifolium subterraneum TaxID=3900 RepID=A0A2Z6NB59_TRISU|nr:hypothetical protein TSUD_158520 [Trifolium subterraneum]